MTRRLGSQLRASKNTGKGKEGNPTHWGRCRNIASQTLSNKKQESLETSVALNPKDIATEKRTL